MEKVEINPLSPNLTKWSNKLKQFVGKLQIMLYLFKSTGEF